MGNSAALTGFRESYGHDFMAEEAIRRSLFDTAVAADYKEIRIPIIEPLSSYSERKTGKSPWPGFEKKSLFAFSIKNYMDNNDKGTRHRVVLIPEGTISVTRWLSEQIENKLFDLSCKARIFYNLRCFRNEYISDLSSTKFREFQQFGLELMNATDEESDIEVLELIFKAIVAIGIPKDAVRLRLSDVGIFNKLRISSGISDDDAVVLKSKLDKLSEYKSLAQMTDLTALRNEIWEKLHTYCMSDNDINIWRLLIESGYNPKIALSEAGCFLPEIQRLNRIHDHFAKEGLRVDIDYAVVRSHQYYTGTSFEIDVIIGDSIFHEVGGGGRYDRLVGSFLKSTTEVKGPIPCVGFAFGMERLTELASKIRLKGK